MLIIMIISISDANYHIKYHITPGIATAYGLRLPWGFSCSGSSSHYGNLQPDSGGRCTQRPYNEPDSVT